jgi:hypothetical protein
VCLLREDPVAGHNSFVEREPRLGIVPVGELPDGMVVRPSRTRGRQAVEDCGSIAPSPATGVWFWACAGIFSLTMPPFCGNLRSDGRDEDWPQTGAFFGRNRTKMLNLSQISGLRLSRPDTSLPGATVASWMAQQRRCPNLKRTGSYRDNQLYPRYALEKARDCSKPT